MSTEQSTKRVVSLSVDSELLDEARRINIDLSEILERQLRDLTRAARELRWRQENAEAFAQYNRRVAERGLLSDEAGLWTDNEPTD
jgi:antitoxin CcdA